MDPDLASIRERMVKMQIASRGINDASVLEAMRTVPRHRFVPEELLAYAYDDGPLPIGEGQTISQPYIVALMTQAAKLDKNSKVLEIGTGSGYAAAILSRIAKEVHTIERLPDLARHAEGVLQDLKYNNIHVHIGDGTLGLPQHGPFDAILVTAGAPVVPDSFIDQLKVGGRVIIPVGDALSQELLRLVKTKDGKFTRELIELVRFVPLIGKQGW